MNILIVCQYYYPEQFRVVDICETLSLIGNDITVLTGLPNYPRGKILPEYRWFRKRQEIVNGVNVIRVPIIGRGNSFVRLALNYISFVVTSVLKVLFMKKSFDVVFVYQLSPVTMVVPALLYKKLTGKKVLLYCLDIWPESIAVAGIGHSSIIYKLLLSLTRKIYQNVDKVLVSSRYFIDYLSDVIGLEKNSIDYLPQYAEEIYLTKCENVHETDENINLLFAGNIGEMQSVETIIKAAAEIREIQNIKWHIVGDGSARIKCEELVKKLNLENSIIFYGHRPMTEMSVFYSKSAALLVTLKDDTFISNTLPGKIQSYMAAGKPIIGAVNGEARTVIEESGCGLCCVAEDYIGLAKNVKRFISEIKNHKEYASNARKYYEDHFSKDTFIVGFVNELNQLIEDD